MTDIVDRLRAGEPCSEAGDRCKVMNGPSGCLCAIAADEIARLNTALATSEAKLEKAREALGMIDNWAKAYPLSVFPEPDFANARKLLEAGGMTLDAISASNMRHVVEGVASIAATTLKDIT